MDGRGGSQNHAQNLSTMDPFWTSEEGGRRERRREEEGREGGRREIGREGGREGRGGEGAKIEQEVRKSRRS